MRSEKFIVESSDTDVSMHLKLSSLFRMMQDTATNNAEEIGFGKRETLEKGYLWVISRYSVTLKEYPEYLDEFEIIAYPCGRNKFIYPRNFIFKNKQGKIIGTASSIWTLLHKDTHRIALHALEDSEVPEEHVEGEEPLPQRIDVNDGEFIEERIVKYSDVDLNGHLNNTKYIEYILDIHDNEFFKENIIANITINYERELSMGNKIQIFIKKEQNVEFIVGKAENQRVFTAKLTLQKRQ